MTDEEWLAIPCDCVLCDPVKYKRWLENQSCVIPRGQCKRQQVVGYLGLADKKPGDSVNHPAG